MASASPKAITFISFGETGQTFSRGSVASSYQSCALAVTGSSIIFSAVTASEAEDVERGVVAIIEKGPLFVDVNPAAPATKQYAAAMIEAAGGHYLDAAVMAPRIEAMPRGSGPAPAEDDPCSQHYGRRVKCR